VSRIHYTLFFEPRDVLLFRDHRPFEPGSHSVAQGRFPAPSTFFGAVRTALILAKEPNYFDKRRGIEEVEELLQAVDPQIRGPFVAKLSHGGRIKRWDQGRSVELLLHMPKDMALPEDFCSKTCCQSSKDMVLPAGIRSKPQRPASAQYMGRGALLKTGTPTTPAIPIRPGRAPKRAGACLLTQTGLEWWQTNQPTELPQQAAMLQRRAYTEEYRVGLALDGERRAHIDGRFYLAGFTRLAPHYGYALELSVPETKQARQWVSRLDGEQTRLGGMSRIARLHLLPGSPLPESWSQAEGSQTRLTLLTPAKASVLLEDQRLRLPEGGSLKIYSWMTDSGALPAGGWDFAARMPKPLEPMLPSGTVFFCELDAQIQIRSVGEPNDSRVGYGAVACGAWKK